MLYQYIDTHILSIMILLLLLLLLLLPLLLLLVITMTMQAGLPNPLSPNGAALTAPPAGEGGQEDN